MAAPHLPSTRRMAAAISLSKGLDRRPVAVDGKRTSAQRVRGGAGARPIQTLLEQRRLYFERSAESRGRRCGRVSDGPVEGLWWIWRGSRVRFSGRNHFFAK